MDRDTYRTILARAIEGELEAHHFYREAALKVRDAFLRDMFNGFADEELKHRDILEAYLSGSDRSIHFTRVPDFHLSETMEAPADVLSTEMKPADAFALAMKKEQAAMRQYTEMAEACTDPEQKKVFLELAAMERGHKAKMENAFVDIGYPEVW